MNTFHITSNIRWKNLPWKKVYKRIYKLQKNIYKASKVNNLKVLYKLQEYILNCNDAKLVAVQKVSEHIFQDYINNNKDKYILNDKDKTIIYNMLFKQYIYDRHINYIVQKVHYYLVYLCLKPEWEAKILAYRSNIVKQTEIYNVRCLSGSILNKCTNLCIINKKNVYSHYRICCIYKYININLIKNNIQALTSIRRYICQSLNNQQLLEVLNLNTILNPKSWNTYLASNLFELLGRIAFFSFQWFNIFNNLYNLTSKTLYMII